MKLSDKILILAFVCQCITFVCVFVYIYLNSRTK